MIKNVHFNVDIYICGNLVLVQDEKEILRLITCGDIGLAEELFENIKKELSEVITES